MENFWQIIDQARGKSNAKTPSASPDALKRVLSTRSDEEVMQFGKEFIRKLAELNRWDLWGAGYVINGGMSDDSFEYFRAWIIGKGPDCFRTAIDNPGELAPFVDTREVENELLEYVTVEVLEARGIDQRPDEGLEGIVNGVPVGTPFDEDDVDDLYPKLAALPWD